MGGDFFSIITFSRAKCNESGDHAPLSLRALCALVRGRRALAAVGGDARVAGEDHLRDRDDGIPVGDERLNDPGQCLRRVLGRVVEQHDAAGLDLGGHALADGVRVVVLPIQRVPIGKDLKPLRRKGLWV